MGKVKVHQWTGFFDWHRHPKNMYIFYVCTYTHVTCLSVDDCKFV